MIDFDLLAFAILILILIIFIYKNRNKIELEKIAFPILYMILYKTKLGLDKMDKLAKRYPKLLNFLSYVSIILGYIGMAFIVYFLFKGAYDYFFRSMPSPVGLVLPRVNTLPGLPQLSFMHWIFAIIILASVHEFSHGVFARLNNIKIKSSGFAMLGILVPIIPAAFVEQDEKSMNKSSTKAQLSVLSAGSFANFITAILALLLLSFVFSPIGSNMLIEKGVSIYQLEENGPADLAGIQQNESIIAINNIKIENLDEFKQEMEKYSPGEEISVQTEESIYSVTLGDSPNSKGTAHLGVFLTSKERVYNEELTQKYGVFSIQIFLWITILFSWLFMINLGVGMFNLLPLGILDGGKMFYLGILHLTKNENLTNKIWKITNIILIALLLVLILPQLYNSLILPLINFII